jgi:hypothetical protein
MVPGLLAPDRFALNQKDLLVLPHLQNFIGRNSSAHYYGERNHQGKGNELLFPEAGNERQQRLRPVDCRHRLGGLLKYYTMTASHGFFDLPGMCSRSEPHYHRQSKSDLF